MREVRHMAYKFLKWSYRNVAVKKDTLVRLIDRLDTNDDGRVSLGEVAAALKELWKAAMGKTSKKKSKVRTVD